MIIRWGGGAQSESAEHIGDGCETSVTRDVTRHCPSTADSEHRQQQLLKDMLHIALRSARASVFTGRASVARTSSLFRSLSTSAIRHSDDHHAAAPSIYGVGAKPGEIPTDEGQSTGLDRVQVLGLLEGVDVFDLEPLDSSRIGTLANPIKVFSVVRVQLFYFILSGSRFLTHLVFPTTAFSLCRTRSASSDVRVRLLTLMTCYGSM